MRPASLEAPPLAPLLARLKATLLGAALASIGLLPADPWGAVGPRSPQPARRLDSLEGVRNREFWTWPDAYRKLFRTL